MTARTLSELIRQIADLHHGGHVHPIARRLGVSSALLYQWRDGQTKHPTPGKLRQLCLAYGLDYHAVLDMVGHASDELAVETLGPRRTRARKPHPIAGGSDNGDYRPVAKSAPIRSIMSTYPLAA